MQRILTSTDLGEGRIRHRVRIESDSCEQYSAHAHLTKQVLLSNFADNPSLLHCGILPFETMKMYHNGEVWIVEVEAIEERSNAKQSGVIPPS